jgi:hypothetical protein
MHFALCDFILDVTQNSVEAGARNIELDLTEEDGKISVRVADDGCGMTEEEKARALDPFYTDGTKHARRKVGLGLPFLVQAVEAVAGEWSLESEKGEGTTLRFSFPADHVDTPPLGDVPGLFRAVLSFAEGCEMRIRRYRAAGVAGQGLEYELLRSELEEAVGNLSEASSLILLGCYLESQEHPGA